MRLLELGNTRWKLANYSDKELSFLGHGMGLNDLLSVLKQDLNEPVIFASVASEDTNRILQHRLMEAGIEFKQIYTQRDYGNVVNSYHHYQRLGVDRWLTLIAAHHLYPGYSAIIDVGTAITFDLLHRDGRHLGGWIAPGMHVMQEALTAKSERIQRRSDAPSGELGQSTEDGLYLGCKAAAEGFIQQAYAHVKQQVEEPVQWLMTGGGLEFLHTTSIDKAQVEPHLVLEGLSVIADKLD